MALSKLIVAIVWLAVAGQTRGDDVRCQTGCHFHERLEGRMDGWIDGFFV